MGRCPAPRSARRVVNPRDAPPRYGITKFLPVATIEQWWEQLGRAKYPNARRLLITADGGGSNGHRPWLWKYELARLAAATGLDITVCHYPPGTSKWNKIEHRPAFRS